MVININIIQMDIEILKPYLKNNKKHSEKQIQKVAKSIKEFGWQQPIVCDKQNTVIIGHCRLEAAKKLGIKKVPVLLTDNLSTSQIKALRLADNKLSDLAEWDFDNIKAELEELKLEEFDIDLTGFDSIELDNLLKEKENINLDDFFEENTKPKEKEKKVLICPHCGEEIEV